MQKLFKLSILSVVMLSSFIQVQAAELLMFEHKGCIACKQFKTEVLLDYKTSEFGKVLPIRSIVQGDKKATKDLMLNGTPFYHSPTFVLIEDGKELGRIRGYAGKPVFWQQIKQLASKNGYKIKG